MHKSWVANPFLLYSFQKRPEPQICPKFVPAIVFGVSSQGDWNVSKICKRLFENYRLSNFDTFFDKFQSGRLEHQKTIAGPNIGQIWGSGVFESCKGEKGSQVLGSNSLVGSAH